MRVLLLCLVLAMTGCASYSVCPLTTGPATTLSQCSVMPKCLAYCDSKMTVEQNKTNDAVPSETTENKPD
jgi:hypothetical protein